jgi:hypothetical protein
MYAEEGRRARRQPREPRGSPLAATKSDCHAEFLAGLCLGFFTTLGLYLVCSSKLDLLLRDSAFLLLGLLPHPWPLGMHIAKFTRRTLGLTVDWSLLVAYVAPQKSVLDGQLIL